MRNGYWNLIERKLAMTKPPQILIPYDNRGAIDLRNAAKIAGRSDGTGHNEWTLCDVKPFSRCSCKAATLPFQTIPRRPRRCALYSSEIEMVGRRRAAHALRLFTLRN